MTTSQGRPGDTPPKDDRPARFVRELRRLERGPLAELRRGLGGDERGTYWLEGLLTRTGYGESGGTQREVLRLVAALYALKPQARDEGEEDGGAPEDEEAGAEETQRPPSVGRLMGRLYLAQGTRPSTERRFLALLDTDRDGLNYQMRQTVMLLATEDLTPDWSRLLTDLLWWGDGVRRTWAQDFYREISRDQRRAGRAPVQDDTSGPPDESPAAAPAQNESQDEPQGETL